jgi:hypothetical protein
MSEVKSSELIYSFPLYRVAQKSLDTGYLTCYLEASSDSCDTLYNDFIYESPGTYVLLNRHETVLCVYVQLLHNWAILSLLNPRKCKYLKDYSLDFEHTYMTTIYEYFQQLL